MKKTAKSILVAMLLTALLLALTGCGNKNNNKNGNNEDKIVGTREQNDDTFGKYLDIMEITFKDDKAEKITTAMEFESEETAKGIATVLAIAGDEVAGIETKQEGKKVMMIMDAKVYAQQNGIEEEKLSKESLRKAMEDEGYQIK